MMTSPTIPNPSPRDCHGWLCWGGLALALGGFLAAEWPTSVNVTPLTLFGGLSLGMGLTRNSVTRGQGTRAAAQPSAISPRG